MIKILNKLRALLTHCAAHPPAAERTTPGAKRVVVFRNDLLPPSETFIKSQVLALTDWKPVLAGYRAVKNGLCLDKIEVAILPGLTAGKVQRRWLHACQLLGLAHPPTVRALRALDANLVHAHFGTDAVDLWPSVRKLGLPMLVTLHGYDINIHRQWWEAGHGGLLRRSYPRRLLRMARAPGVHFTAVSKAIRKRAIEYGIPESKIVVRYIGVDTNQFKPGRVPVSQRGKRMLFVGRMVEKKSPLLMVRAYADVRQRHPDAELHMAGGGALLSDAQALSQRLNVPVKFLGSVNAAAVRRELDEATVLCLPSVTTPHGDAEGLPIVLLEAQASGLPVVTSALGGATEAIEDGITGYPFAPGNQAEFVRQIAHILNNPAQADAMAAAGVIFVKRTFDIRDLTTQLESSYDTVKGSTNT